MKLHLILGKIVEEAENSERENRTFLYRTVYSLLHGAETEIEVKMIDAAIDQIARTKRLAEPEM